MIRVHQAEEPETFNETVRRPGRSYLENLPSNAAPDWKKRNYWTRCLPDLRVRYGSVCAYTGIRIPPNEGTVDHFMPKSTHPEFAYEWSNFRLSLLRINAYKGTHEDILDPFEIGESWFFMDIMTGKVSPNPELDETIQKQVQTTIERLHLNDSEYRNRRIQDVDDFMSGKITFGYLKTYAPFVASEIQRCRKRSEP